MPGLNGTGPLGYGPGTGRGFGYCNPNYTNQNFVGRGGGRGMLNGGGRRGGGRGMFRNFGMNQFQNNPNYQNSPAFDNNTANTAYLTNKIEEYEAYINELKQQLEELKNSESDK